MIKTHPGNLRDDGYNFCDAVYLGKAMQYLNHFMKNEIELSLQTQEEERLLPWQKINQIRSVMVAAQIVAEVHPNSKQTEDIRKRYLTYCKRHPEVTVLDVCRLAITEGREPINI